MFRETRMRRTYQRRSAFLRRAQNEDPSKYGIKELRDGLTLEEIKQKYPWILKADIENAVLGKEGDKLVWYDGFWKNGTWMDGIWKGGYWNKGTWLNGTWEDGWWQRGIWISGQWLARDKDAWHGGYDRKGNYHYAGDPPSEWSVWEALTYFDNLYDAHCYNADILAPIRAKMYKFRSTVTVPGCFHNFNETAVTRFLENLGPAWEKAKSVCPDLRLMIFVTVPENIHAKEFLSFVREYFPKAKLAEGGEYVRILF